MTWLISKALMNSLCLPGQVEEFLEDTCLDGEQFAQLNGSNTPQAYCAPDKMMGFSRLSRFGMMYKPLMENLGEELLMSYRAGFHAKTLVQQGKGLELKVNGQECGEKWRASFTKYDPDSCSWKTHQCSLLGGLDEFLATWPQWGLMRDGECWEQVMLEQTIRGTEFGLSENKWATPTTMDKLPPKSEKALHREATQARPGRSKPANLRDQVSNMQNWPTPRCQMTRPVAIRDDMEKGHRRNLEEVVATREIWPTPRSCSAMAATITPESAWNEKRNPNLETIVGRVTFPTPTAHNSKEGAYPAEFTRKTPTLATHAGGKLNPMWVEWLMGWPLGWTDLKPLETVKFPFAPQQHGGY